MKFVGSADFDLIVMEGFHWLIAKDESVYKILTSRKVADSLDILKTLSPPILAITYLEDKAEIPACVNIPVFHLFYDKNKLIELVKEKVHVR
jgi:hypothetical protein